MNLQNLKWMRWSSNTPEAEHLSDSSTVEKDGMIYHGSRDEPGEQPKVQQVIREGEKVGRNDPCPCGSGKKYKKCHGKS